MATIQKYNTFLSDLESGLIDLDSHTLRVMLVTSSYTYAAAHDQKADVVAYEASGAGYVAGGAELAGKTITPGATAVLDATDVAWAASTITARGAVIYDDSATNDPLIAYIDFGSNQSTSGTTFTIQWNASGIVGLT
jgi:hypothetical protein